MLIFSIDWWDFVVVVLDFVFKHEVTMMMPVTIAHDFVNLNA